MKEDLGFKYFYGKESESFTFYRIPKALMTEEVFKVLTSDAKILYGLMLDRISLSAKNGWFDEEGRVYIYYSIEDVMESMGCSKNKGMKTLQELDFISGIGLIERKKQGQGKPTIIYVKNFQFRKSVPESQNVGIKNPIICDSRISKCGSLESQDMNPNDNKYNNTLLSDTECSTAQTIRISGDDKPASVVKSRFMKLDSEHIQFVMSCLKENTTRVRSIKSYLLATLYNAPLTISNYYQSLVNSDMAEGKI